MKPVVLLGFVILGVFAFAGDLETRALARPDNAAERASVITLGERLFRDARFSTPKGDLPAACSDCHLYDQDPQGLRAYADFFNRSWVSSRNEDPRRLGLRNAPTILDAGEMPQLHYDGEFTSLEALVRGTISGRPMGWLPGEENEAFEHARSVVLNDKGTAKSGSYREQFNAAFSVNIESLKRDEIVSLISRSVAAYCRTLTTHKNSPYDRFIALNNLDKGPAAGENGRQFGARMLSSLDALEAKHSLKLAAGFDKTAVLGMRIFYGVEKGNCVACHTPPQFTDYSFRNIGVSQREYERLNGDGSFAQLAIPGASSARRPSPQFRETPIKGKPGIVDLGFWNFVDLKTSKLRREGETDDRFLERMIATFKTPTLRNLSYTYPYFHDGSLSSLEAVLEEMLEVNKMAREGRIRSADEELAKMKFSATDIPALVVFLNSLNEDLR